MNAHTNPTSDIASTGLTAGLENVAPFATPTKEWTQEELDLRYDAWRFRFSKTDPTALVMLIVKTTKFIDREYPDHSPNRKFMLKKLEAMQDAAIDRMN